MTLIKDSSARAGKLAALFRDTLHGKRTIKSPGDAKLFFEAVQAQSPPSTVVESIIASKHGLDAVRLAVRADISHSFIQSHTLPFVNYLADEQLKVLADGQFLRQLLVTIASPPTLWNALSSTVLVGDLTEDNLRTFSWLCFELLSLPNRAEVDVVDDVQAIVGSGKLIESTNPEIRQFGYKIQHLLQLRKSPNAADHGYAPGGRHDNDFSDFRQIAVYPTSDEFLSTERPFYRRVKEVFETDMSERAGVHLDNIYRLTREDLLGELRNDWQIAQGRKKGKRSALTLQKLTAIGLELGKDHQRKKCSLAIRCEAGLGQLEKKDPSSRKKFLLDNTNYLKHQAFGALYQGQDIYGFAFVDRDLDGLVMSPPVVVLRFTDDNAFKKALLALKTSRDVMFTVLFTPVFAYEPVLERLKDMKELPLQENLLDPSATAQIDEFVPHKALRRTAERLTLKAADEELEIRLAGFLESPGSKKTFKLDQSQRASLTNALTQRISVIQGPPGTGKSFIGALATHIILSCTSLKILVITYTNHALDQFLEDLMNLGIEEEKMVRLGSKSTDRTSPLLLFSQKSGYRRTKEAWGLVDNLKENVGQEAEELRDAFTTYLQASPSFASILDHLEFSDEDQIFHDAFIVPAEVDNFTRVGKRNKEIRADHLFVCWKNGQGPGPVFAHHAFQNHKGVWDIESPTRKKYVEKWTRAIIQEKADRVSGLSTRYNRTQDDLQSLLSEGKVEILREKRIVGCTTTAASMYTKLITAAQPDVVMVEEAGEIQESHILTALTPSVKQLILIGDHLQLRPKINNYALTVEKGDGYDLNRSLFERLIIQGQTHTTLHKQHRMHPAISILVRELTYPDLADSDTTMQRPTIRGFEDRVIFVNHDVPELEANSIKDRRDPGSTSSKENVFEAEMVLKCVKYLSQQGYGTKDMVVLTPYLGQLRVLRDMLMDEIDPSLSDLDSFELIQAGQMTQAAASVGKTKLRLSTIDNYQGEESDIVIVSLTRSNERGDIGFLSARERLNVLLSRARNCLLMIGNMETFMKSKKGKETWVPFFESMKVKSHLYDGVPVRCERHPEKAFLLKEPADFDRCCPDGGCAEPCGVMLNCKVHICQKRCHRVLDHSKVNCTQLLERVCDRQHKRKVPCHKKDDKCSKCVEEDAEAERRIKRDLKLEAERIARQAAYKQELEQIQDEIEHQRRIIRYHQDDENQKQTLDQQRADLAAVRDAATRIQNAPKPAAQATKASRDASVKSDGSLDIPSNAKEEWEHLKQFEGAKSDPLDELMGMIGLEEVKEQFLSIKSKADATVRQGISLAKERFSCSMLGNPGTGKTTVARLYSQFMTSIGAIRGTCFKEETGASLANSGVSGCKKIIEDMLNDGGGVLFIDEAYQLTSGNSPGGRAVLDYLLAEVENLSGKVVFVLAGYNKQMESFFGHNPGLPSRFPIDMKFADYTDDELLRILELKVHKKYDGRMKCDDGLKGLYCRIVARRVGRGRGREGFGNARTIENTLAIISSRQSDRLRRERRAGKKPDDLFLTKEDLIGPEPSGALKNSQPWQKLQSLIGLKAVKEAVKSLLDTVTQNYLRELAEEPPIEFSLNRVFLGNPGTGKTTVAKLYAGILVDLGMLSKGEVIVKNPSDFVGAALGQSEQQTKGILAASLGKVLVIDEAYGLYGGGGQGSTGDPYKTAVIDTIVAEVQSVPGDDRCVLLLGYKDQMEDMFQNVNPGLSRRFPISSAFEFEDFDDDGMRKILDLKLKQQGYEATDQAKRVAIEILNRARNRPNFGNAGEIDILLDAAKPHHQSRLSSGEAKSAATFDAQDFDENFDRAERSDTNVRALFKGTVGNEAVISLLEGYQETVRIFKSLDEDPRENIPFNFLFRGPPGTGKTTTAKKMGKVFYDMGFLATAEVFECSATDLIGQYIGQTGPKVQKLLDQALGRVLFVDEAYRLADGHFAKEAMDELVDCTTKDKYAKKLIIILAGYEEDINRLMTMNPGLTSRFPEVIDFRSLTAEECVQLLTQMLQARKTTMKSNRKKKVDLDLSILEAPDRSFFELLKQTFSQLSHQNNWASARDVGTLAKSIFNQTIKDKNGIASGHLHVTEMTVTSELTKMLQERASRSQNATAPPLQMPFDMPPPAAPPVQGPPRATAATTQHVTTEPADDPTQEEKPNPKAKTQTKPDSQSKRDAGVSDEVWEQLQKDREAEERREQEHKDLLEAARTAREAEREKIVKKLLDEEARRKREAEAKKKLAMMGACPVGYEWIKQSGGYRCAGGSHFMSDAALKSG